MDLPNKDTVTRVRNQLEALTPPLPWGWNNDGQLVSTTTEEVVPTTFFADGGQMNPAAEFLARAPMYLQTLLAAIDILAEHLRAAEDQLASTGVLSSPQQPHHG